MNKPLRELADIHYGKSPNEVLIEEGIFPVVGTGGVYGKAKQALFDGPAVVVARKGSLGNPQLMIEPFWPVDTTYAVVPKNGIDARWLFYNLDKYDLTKLNEATGVPSISRDWLYKITFDDPGTSSQKRIGDILETIDESITRTETLIAKYQQIKAGLMHDLFTRGVTKDGKLRPPREEAPELYKKSPIGWIPKEWRTELLDKLAMRGSGHTPSKSHPEYWNGGIKWISLADSHRLDHIYISETENEISNLGLQNSSAVLHPPGIVVLSRDAGIGKSAITTDYMAVSQHFICWRCGSDLDNHYLYYWLQYNKRVFENIAVGSTIPTIGLGFFKKYEINAPIEIKEQRKIGQTILAADRQLIEYHNNKDKLVNMKQGLMHDLLTGRVRVNI
jgi:type I restriction enzyme S subunit